jgi:hypothetical protein
MNTTKLPGFRAEASIRGRHATVGVGKTATTPDEAGVVPQLSLSCGNATLNTICFPFAAPAWLPCESAFFWNQGWASSCIFAHMVAHAPWCAPCTVTAP